MSGQADAMNGREDAELLEAGAAPRADGASGQGAGAPTEGAPDAAEEASERALAEHNALARVFDDVRAQSREGQLVSPTRWPEIGLVPDHMDAEEFEMFVYDYWQGEHPGEGLEAPSEQARADAPSARAERPAVPSPRSAVASSAIPSVGTPPFLRARGGAVPVRHAASAAPAPSAEEGRPASPTAGDGPVAAVGDSPVASPDGSASARTTSSGLSREGRAEAAAEAAQGRPASADTGEEGPFSGLDLPEGYKLAVVEGEWVLVPDEDARPVELTIDCTQVAALVGHYSYYLYDRSCMTDAYARWAFLAAEDDDRTTFVDCVREESRTYPRPMPLESLENEPFSFSRERIIRTWDEVRASDAYPDIRQIAASNGDLFFYSTRYLSPDYAASLAEWAAVERLHEM